MHESDEKLLVVNRIVSKSPVIIFIWQNSKRWPVVFVSNNVESWMGYTSEEFINGHIVYADIVHPDDLERVKGEVTQYSNEQNRIDFSHKPYRIITKDGQVKWFTDRTTICRDEFGDITHYEGVLMDITEIKQNEELLLENKKKIYAFTYNIPGMIYRGNKDWTVNIISNSEMICGYPKEDFLQKKINWIDLIHPDDRNIVFKYEPGFLEKPTSIIQEYRIITKNKSIKYISDHKTSRFTSDMLLDGVDGIVFDITEKKISEQELIIAKERAERNELDLKERVKELIGIFKLGVLSEKTDNLDEIYNEFVNTIVPESMMFPENVHATLTINGQLYCNYKNYHPPKDKKCLKGKINAFNKQIGELNINYTKDLPFNEIYEQNLIEIFAQKISNIIEKNWAQLELKRQNEEYATLNKELIKAIKKVEESELKFKDIFDFSKDSIIITSNDYQIIMANKSTCTTFGYTHKDLINLSIKKLFKNDKEIDEKLHMILRGEMSVTDDIPMQKKDGSIFFTDVTATPLILDGESFFLCSIRDITERKQIQQQILRAIIETEENERKRVAQELHDGIGPILSTIKLFTETYLNSNNEEYKKEISKQLLSSINEALEQVSIISGSLSPQILVDFGLRIAIKKFIDKLNRISPLNISFRYNLKVCINSEIEITIYRIVIELINNTVKHARAKIVELSIDYDDSNIIIEYSDDGIGFDYSKTLETVSGMGLFNIQNRVKSLNGEISFNANENNRTKYSIKIPL